MSRKILSFRVARQVALFKPGREAAPNYRKLCVKKLICLCNVPIFKKVVDRPNDRGSLPAQPQ